MQQESNNFIPVNKVPWEMVARWAEGGEVAAALFEDTFGGVEYFLLVCFMCMGLVIGRVLGGQSQ
jgi:hypothetical protein